MLENAFSTEHLDYLQRSDFKLSRISADVQRTSAPPELRRLFHITAIGQSEKQIPNNPQQERPTFNSEDIFMGLYGLKIPFAYLLHGTPAGISLYMGVWSPAEREAASAAMLNTRAGILDSIVSSLYPEIERAEVDPQLPTFDKAGLVLGNPTLKLPDALDGAVPADRLIRAMTGSHWACLILAEPIDEAFISQIRMKVINEMRAVESVAGASGSPSPLAQYYLQLLQPALTNLTYGQSMGAWRTAVYLLGDKLSYYRLAGVWRGVFAGEMSLPEGLQVGESKDVLALAGAWAMPDLVGEDGPGFYSHPFQLQSVLASDQLSAYVHFPRHETIGFAVNSVPRFDVVPSVVESDNRLSLGAIMQNGRPSAAKYHVAVDELTGHAFVAGVTGAGKTRTLFHLLREMRAQGKPFLVIEPAKTEYRTLIAETGIDDRFQVFTLGNERHTPLRLNPFEVMKDIPVSVHIDLIRSLFSASFGMWTPLPQILEQCIYQVYADKGWDITANTNHRISGDRRVPGSFPTLTDVLLKVEEVTRQLGYDKEFTANARAALSTRLNSLRIGGKGAMLDVHTSFPIAELLDRPTVIELESIGDDNDKAFVIGLLLIRLAEWRRTQGPHKGLEHLLVIEEAHRLLANVAGDKKEEEADPRGKAVESFVNLLAEIRAYGQGVVIVDQVPVKLAPDVIKNTNLKIAHRILAQDDRAALAGAMAMNEKQAQALATLKKRETIVFSEGDDLPLLVRTPFVEAPEQDANTIADLITTSFEDHLAQAKLDGLYHSHPTCAALCETINPDCVDLRATAGHTDIVRAVAAFILSLVVIDNDHPLKDVFAGLAATLHAAVRPHLKGAGDAGLDTRCLLTHAAYRALNERGAQYNWDFETVAELTALLLPALMASSLDRALAKDTTENLASFRTRYREACALTGPYYGCEDVCGKTCFHRYSIRPLAQDADLQESFRAAVASQTRHEDVGALAEYATDQVLLPDVDGAARDQSELCFVVQQTDAWKEYGLLPRRKLVDEMIEHVRKD